MFHRLLGHSFFIEHVPAVGCIDDKRYDPSEEQSLED